MISSEQSGIFLLLASLVCLGTWPALLRLCTHGSKQNDCCDDDSINESSHNIQIRNNQTCASRLVYQLKQDRHPCHAYIDYTVAYVLFSSTVPFILSCATAIMTSSEDDNDHQQQPDNQNMESSKKIQIVLILITMVGGSLLSLGNIATQWSTTVYGAPLTTVLAMQASLTVALGTSINYLLEPERTAYRNRLAFGVLMFLVAIVLSVLAQQMYSSDKERHRAVSLVGDDEWYQGNIITTATESIEQSQEKKSDLQPLDYHSCRINNDCDAGHTTASFEEEKPNRTNTPTKNTTLQQFNIQGSSSRAKTTCVLNSYSTTGGMWIAFYGGLCFGFFSPAFNIAVNDPFQWYTCSNSNRKGGLSVPTANFWFSVSFAVTSVIWNLILMRHHHLLPGMKCDSKNQRNQTLSDSSIQEYLYSVPLQTRILALSSGIICALGNVLQFQGGKLAGYAASDLVQAFPLVGTLYDVFLFGEFQGANLRVIFYIVGMYIVYLGGVGFLILSIAYQ